MSKIIDDNDVNFAWHGDAWSVDHRDDPSTPQYSDSTLYVFPDFFVPSTHATTRNSDYVVIAWKGTDISVFGARRDNHGIYGVQVDGGAVQYYSGYSNSSQFQQVLYATTGLADGNHEIKVSNENNRNVAQYPNYVWLDIDHVSLTGTLLNANPNANAATDVKPSTTTTSTQPPPTSSSAPPPPPPSSSSAVVSSVMELVTSSAPTSSAASSAVSSGPKTGGTVSASVLGSAAQFSPSAASGSTSAWSSTSGAMTSASPLPSTDSSAAEDNGKTGNKTTVVAVSVTVIVIAAVVIATIAGLWWWRRRRRLREEQEDDQRDYLAPQSSWR